MGARSRSWQDRTPWPTEAWTIYVRPIGARHPASIAGHRRRNVSLLVGRLALDWIRRRGSSEESRGVGRAASRDLRVRGRVCRRHVESRRHHSVRHADGFASRRCRRGTEPSPRRPLKPSRTGTTGRDFCPTAADICSPRGRRSPPAGRSWLARSGRKSGRSVLAVGSNAMYSEPGYLIFHRETCCLCAGVRLSRARRFQVSRCASPTRSHSMAATVAAISTSRRTACSRTFTRRAAASSVASAGRSRILANGDWRGWIAPVR